MHVQLYEVVVQDLWHRAGHVEEHVVCAVLGYDTQLLHNQLGVGEPRHKVLSREVLRESSNGLQDRGEVLQDSVELLALQALVDGESLDCEAEM